ncbi:PREDICTED: uncharacterized protein LOC104603026 [Nelumbo nucifera]|uniref:Uncharacterized protein LOC104603026 n=2 Tax=Nelumbo nucifera TaxID=4432 RepID=A0A1U8AQL1_NELNU|nr:PREDICTED: uncharacterized protein LOC104603026 [Nelumbo nucifera]DAD31707.1 TPA_asm: hypothetical protein HUJ06_010558 [Nelumbo nucifera]
MAVSQTSASKPIVSTKSEAKKKKKKAQSGDDQQPQEQSSVPQPPCSSPSKRAKSPGLRVVGGRIYDSENGKTCHQCRQKTMDFVASCKNQRDDKPCTIKFCHKCLLNRYGEKAEEVALLGDWKCPKCRGICNCSFCMKKRGHQPTGILVHTAKATGFSSVSEMLHVKGPENVGAEKILKNVVSSPKKQDASNKVTVTASPKKVGKENLFAGKVDLNSQPKPLTSDGDDKKNGKSKRKKILQNDATDSVGEVIRDDGAPAEKKSTKKSRISKEVSVTPTKKEVKTANQSGKSQPPEKKKSQVQGSEVVPSDPIAKNEKTDKRDGKLAARNKKEVPDSGNADNISAKQKPLSASRKLKKNCTSIHKDDSDADVPLPNGIDVATVAGIDFSPEDVGHALQFLEFCEAFGQVLDMKKGQAESVLRELMRGRSGRRGMYSSIVRFHIQLLSLILKDAGEESLLSPTSSGNSWLKALGKCISESQCTVQEIPSDCFDRGSDGYDKLDASKKLRVLTFLCDETLGTAEIRNWIDEQNSKFVEKEKEAREKVIAAKNKEKGMKQKLQNEIAKAIIEKNGAPLSISEHDDLVANIKTEAAKAHSETLEAMEMASKKKQRSDAVRTEPTLRDENGHAFWRLRSYSDGPNFLLQDVGSWDSSPPQEKWFTFDDERTKMIENYISSVRRKRLRMRKVPDVFPSGSDEAKPKHDSSDDLPSLVIADSEEEG